MRGRFLDRKSRKQFRHPLPPATATAAAPIVPRHRLGTITPPPPGLLAGGVRRGPVRGLGQTARPVVPGSRRVHQPAPCPALYRGGARRGWINQQTQPRPVARRHRSNWPHGICVQSGWVAHVLSHPGKKGNGNGGGGGGKPPPKPPPATAAPVIPGSRRVRSPIPYALLAGASRRGRLPGEVTPFVRFHGRRVQNPQARPAPEQGNAWRPRIPVVPPITNLTSIPVCRGHRQIRSPWPQPPAGMCRRGRVPAPTAPFLLREGRRLRGTRPPPVSGQARRGPVPRAAQVARVLVRRHRFCRVFLPAPTLFQGRNWRGLLFLTGVSAQVTVFPCDVLPARPEQAEECAVRPEFSESPAGRPESEETCPVRPPRCPGER